MAPHFGKIQAPNKQYQWVASAIPAFTVQLGLWRSAIRWADGLMTPWESPGEIRRSPPYIARRWQSRRNGLTTTPAARDCTPIKFWLILNNARRRTKLCSPHRRREEILIRRRGESAESAMHLFLLSSATPKKVCAALASSRRRQTSPSRCAEVFRRVPSKGA